MAKLALLFPGQGAQTLGMGKDLANQLSASREVFSKADEILGYSLSELCFEGPEATLHHTNRSQPALFVHSIAALEKLKAEMPAIFDDIAFTAGLSLGEYTAMAVAGSLSFEDCLRVVQCRGDAMQASSDLVESGMASVLGMETEAVEQVCIDAREEGEVLQVANYLCPGNIAISGHNSAIERASQLASERGAFRVVRLKVAGAFHTELMRPAVPLLESALAKASLVPPQIPVVSNVDANIHSSPDELKKILVSQVCSPVYWEQSIRFMVEQGVEKFYEVGTGTTLKGILKRIDRSIPCENIG
ncbi:MAG TPA: ACP S-malonyltransferase [Pirellulaceae bacterium]|nr:ACP S-malonyltransferase [Pirellulaceae bacterium]HMO90639.1 ACP S-malonyltransferase [Pirellulaceae bacterium]HMP67782.1 ACP S-malonyltransferase [Pirellulaceae bacterium]